MAASRDNKAAARPPRDFKDQALLIEVIPKGQKLYRVFSSAYGAALTASSYPSRFSHPRPNRAGVRLYGVLYLGASIATCFAETILRHNANGTIGAFPIHESEFSRRRAAEIAVLDDLLLLDLRPSARTAMHIPPDVASASSHKLARQWSLSIHRHRQKVDGILYPSHFTGELNVALYDRAVAKLVCIEEGSLVDRLQDIPFDKFSVSIVGDPLLVP